MKKVFSLVFLSIFLSCDDGNLLIETVDFDSIEIIGSCEEVSATTANVLFKINVDEALILALPAGMLKNEIITEDIESAIPSASQLTYRIFTGDVSTNYFCDDLPPVSPTVSEEITAEDGSVLITTTTEDSITFEHSIRLINISFVTEDGSRITDLQVSEFGTVTTSL